MSALWSERSGTVEHLPVDETSLEIVIDDGTGSPVGDEAHPKVSKDPDRRSVSLSSVIPGLSESPIKTANDLVDW